MSEEKTEIKKLLFTINGHDHIVSIDEAKKLHEALHELFGNKTETIWYPIYRQQYFDRWTPMWSSLDKATTNVTTSIPAGINQNNFTTDTLRLSIT